MGRRLVLSSLAALLFLALPAYGAQLRPRLALAGATVRGSHFHARERVRVTMTTTSTVVRSVRTSRLGAFTVALAAAPDPCNGAVVITASGAAGDHAQLKVMPRGCPPD